MNIAAYQAALRECPKVYVTYVYFEGETSIDAVYDTKEAAQMHKDWYNNQKGYRGKASVDSLMVRNADLVPDRFVTKEGVSE